MTLDEYLNKWLIDPRNIGYWDESAMKFIEYHWPKRMRDFADAWHKHASSIEEK